MSKRLRRVERALADTGLAAEIRKLEACRTDSDAASAIGCALDQIVRAVIFRGHDSGRAPLFLTAGGNRIDREKAILAAGENLDKADAGLIRETTGFSIGGIAPLGHLPPPRAFFDQRLPDFGVIWGAAGTPRHVFAATPQEILRESGAELADFTCESA